MSRVSLQAQIDEVSRELTVRASEYGGRVRRGELRASAADMHIDRMRAALRTLQWVQRHQALITAAVAAVQGSQADAGETAEEVA